MTAGDSIPTKVGWAKPAQDGWYESPEQVQGDAWPVHAGMGAVGCTAVVRADVIMSPFEESGKRKCRLQGKERPQQGQSWGTATKSLGIGALLSFCSQG